MADPRTAQRVPSIATSVSLAWLLPGLGHWWIGEKKRAIIFFVVITATFWTGVAVGGVRTTVTPRDNGLWIAAQLCAGPQAIGALSYSNSLASDPKTASLYKASWPASDIGVVYAGVAGLLNLLIILDALSRTERAQAEQNRRGPASRGGR